MEFHRLRYFVEVARKQSFSKAAQHCHVSQPSLSQQIKKLEEEVGEPLFLRTRRGIGLTDCGRAFFPKALSILNAVDSAHEHIRHQNNDIQGVIRVGAIPTIAPYLMPRLISQTLKQHPGINFELHEETTEQLVNQLLDGQLDMAILSPPFPGEAETTGIDLFEDELLITLPSNHPKANSDFITLKEIESFPAVIMKDAHCLGKQSLALCKQSNIQPRIRMLSSQLETVLALVESGIGLTFIPRMAVASHASRKVSYHSVSPTPVSRRIAIHWPKLQSPSRVQTAFLEQVKKTCHS